MKEQGKEVFPVLEQSILQQLVETMEKEAVPLQPMDNYIGVDIHIVACGGPCRTASHGKDPK